MDFMEAADFDSGIDLCRGDGCVPQDFLDHTEVGATGKKVGGKAVAEGMRRDSRR
jgi:hypothetical protein